MQYLPSVDYHTHDTTEVRAEHLSFALFLLSYRKQFTASPFSTLYTVCTTSITYIYTLPLLNTSLSLQKSLRIVYHQRVSRYENETGKQQFLRLCLFFVGAVMNDPQIQNFAFQMKQRVEFNSIVNNVTSDCWDKCITYTIGNLDSKQEKCMTNCVQRFMDVSKMFTQQYATQKSQFQKPSEEFGSKLYN